MGKEKIQGEGDYEATRRYRQRTEEFLENHDVEQVAEDAKPATGEEAKELEAAEAEAKRRAKGEDPALRRPDAPNAEPSTRGETSRH
jgi:hypothetical protein